MLTTSVKSEEPTTFTFPCATDTVSVQYSTIYGDGSGQDICGPRSYELFEVEGSDLNSVSFASIEELLESKKISVGTDDSQFVGPHDMVLKITLLDYNIFDFQSFDAQIDPCEITDLQPAAPNFLDQVYVLDDPPLEIGLPLYI